MKKISKVLSALLVASVVCAMPLCVSAGNDAYYASNGVNMTVADAHNDRGHSMFICPGAMVIADYGMFDTLLVNSLGDGYSCFGSSTGSETLTLGFYTNANTEYSNYMPALQATVAKQIQYIKNIGGVMTGYSFVDDGHGAKAINISWDVGRMHHFARFELDRDDRKEIGYYDLMYNDSSNVDINSLNDSLVVLF